LLARVLLLAFAALPALPSAALTGARLVGGSIKTPIPQLAAFAPWATIGWALALVALLAGRWWLIAGVVGVVLLVQICWIVPAAGSRTATVVPPGAIDVQVMTVNVKIGTADVGHLLELVRANRVDLLAVVEARAWLVRDLKAGLGPDLPYVVQANPEHSATFVWSRWPIRSLGPSLGVGREICQVLLEVPGAVPVTVTAVHTISPGPFRIRPWNLDLATLTTTSAATVGPQVLLGDFNASRDHSPFRALLRTGLVDAAEAVRMSPWAGVTWPSDRVRMPASVRLDHVLVTPGPIAVCAVRVIPLSGSDHRAVVADLRIAPAG
jgi:endonuclease/exonuclease/phosphatase (EEP) superfamily protein YafD